MMTKESFDLMGEVLREDIKKSFDVWVRESPEARLLMQDITDIFRGKIDVFKGKRLNDKRDS
jgi:hypothetical protein